jgi:hypothetical protein
MIIQRSSQQTWAITNLILQYLYTHIQDLRYATRVYPYKDRFSYASTYRVDPFWLLYLTIFLYLFLIIHCKTSYWNHTLRNGITTDRAVAQAASRWLPTAAARVRVRAACGVCGGQSGIWAGFSPSTSVSPANHSNNFSIIIITRADTVGLLVAAVLSGPNWTPPLTIPI